MLRSRGVRPGRFHSSATGPRAYFSSAGATIEMLLVACIHLVLLKRSVLLPGNRPVFVRPSRPDHEVAIRAELVDSRQVLTDKNITCICPQHLMGYGVTRLVDSEAAEGSLVTVE